MFSFTHDAPAAPEAACRRCDAKWLSTVLAAVCIAGALAFQAAATLTDEKPSVAVIAHVFSLMVSPKGIDDPTDVDGLREMLATKGGAEVKPFPGMEIRVKESDIAGMTPREVRLFLFRQVGEPLWQSGEDGVARVFEDENTRAELRKQGIGMFRYFTRDTHDRLEGWAVLMLILACTFSFASVAASRGFGRLVTPALALFTGSLPLSLGGWWAGDRIKDLAETAVIPGENPLGYVAHVLGIALSPYAGSINGPANVAVSGAILLLIAAFAANGAVFVFVSIRGLIQRLRKAKK